MSDLKRIADTLRQHCGESQLQSYSSRKRLRDAIAGIVVELENQAAIDAKRFDDSTKLQAIGKSAFDSIAEMVAALEVDYDRLEELREWRTNLKDSPDTTTPMSAGEIEELAELEEAAGDCENRDDAEQRIMEDPLSVQVRGDWHSIGDQENLNAPAEFEILLGTGGPATRIMGELDENGQPTRAWIQAQDWFLPWTDYIGGDSETLLTYCRCFYFGEG